VVWDSTPPMDTVTDKEFYMSQDVPGKINTQCAELCSQLHSFRVPGTPPTLDVVLSQPEDLYYCSNQVRAGRARWLYAAPGLSVCRCAGQSGDDYPAGSHPGSRYPIGPDT
jgi:hypothetical protein